jgi:hypothetical protein
MDLPKVTFGMIVLNGEPFIRYNLRSLYPFAHQIIVVEGAAPGAAHIATPDGHSKDGTLDVLRDFQTHEDPEHKLSILTAEDEGHPDGFWASEKEGQSQAYAKHATGDFLWQVDVDEFYMPEDIRTILEMLRCDESITALSFKQITFWGGFDYITDGWYLRRGWCADGIHRIFKWGAGYRYISHRPVTVYNAQDEDLHRLHWVNGNVLARKGIYMYHYSLIFPKQVFEKCEYYKQADWARRTKALRWAEENFQKLGNPYHVHNVYDYPSWLERYIGNHPPQIEILHADVRAARIDFAVRPIDDIEKLLQSHTYMLGRAGLRFLEPFSRWWMPGFLSRQRLKRFMIDPSGSIKKLLLKVIKSGGQQP